MIALAVQSFALDFDSTSRVMAAGRAAYPAVEPSDAIRALVEPCAEAALAAGDARAAELYLAMACATGDLAAISALDAMLPAMIRPALARLGAAASDDDEIIQRARVTLFTGSGERAPGIAGYSARGDLRSYVRAIAARLALKRFEREELPSPDDDTEVLALLPTDGDSPELRVLKEHYRDDVRRAFAAAIAALSPRDRTLLRQHYVDAVSLEALAALHGVHRATCARWLASAREEILSALREQLHASHGNEPRDLESAIELVRSQLDLSLSRHLR
jgi:RNA polymerase sigma-70 factor (ECF subfamily)